MINVFFVFINFGILDYFHIFHIKYMKLNKYYVLIVIKCEITMDARHVHQRPLDVLAADRIRYHFDGGN